MAEESMTLLDVLRKGEVPAEDVLRTAVQLVVRELMEAEVSAQIGAERYEYVREDGRVLSMAVISAHGVWADGVREVLGVDVGLSQDVVLWRTFLQSPVARRLRGVQLVTSDAHRGLNQASPRSSSALPGSAAGSTPSGRNPRLGGSGSAASGKRSRISRSVEKSASVE